MRQCLKVERVCGLTPELSMKVLYIHVTSANIWASQKTNLKRHKQSVHEGVKYPCNKCEYQATTKGALQRHQKSEHEGVKYSCNQCEYQAKEQDSLKRHQQSNHESVKYSCNHCEHPNVVLRSTNNLCIKA